MNACTATAPSVGFPCDQPAGHDGRHLALTWDGEPLASWPQGSHLAPPNGYGHASLAAYTTTTETQS